MATNLAIDPQLLAKALEDDGEGTKRAIGSPALRRASTPEGSQVRRLRDVLSGDEAIHPPGIPVMTMGGTDDD